ncbi:MAG: chemotaxis protein CheW [Proteobacteria bacterium]|nr:chemotaxis protein CheW [Pseudomonadota bacterium]
MSDPVDDLVSDFIAETREGLEALDSELVRFEACPDDPASLGEVFRLIHTIKGTCGFLGLQRLQTVAHSAENVLGGFRDGEVAVTPTAVSAILDTVDLIRSLIDSLASTGVEPEGDDSAIIDRLEMIFAGGGVQDATGVAPAPEEPAPQAKAEEAVAARSPSPAPSRSLIDRLGGDSTLDAAVEMALPKMVGDPRLGAVFAGVDHDRMQAGLRDALCQLARRETPGTAFEAAIAALVDATPDAGVVEAVFRAIADAAAALDAEASDLEKLRGLAAVSAPPEAQRQEPAVAPAFLPRDVCPSGDRSGDVEPEVVQKAPTRQPPARSAASEAPVRSEGESAAAQTIRVSVDALEHLMTVVSELVLIRNQLIQTLRLEPESPFAAPLNRLNQVTSELQEGVMTTRMQPISGAWAKLPRLVRDLAQDLGKTIELQMFGQETELDRQVLELIKDPLTHMIRNAADHGLETPAERRAAGKPETGRITLQARHEGGAIVIEVADDGRGLPADRIRDKAVSSGLLSSAQAEQMSDAEARQLIFMPGFSTASQVTSVSGRGVGMDVVRTNIEKIGGVIELSSVPGGGTRFTIRIPLTLTIVSALIVECCGERFAMPQSAIVELVSASESSGRTIEYIDGAAVLRLRDRLLPLISLQALLGLEPSESPLGETCIVVARVGAFNFGVTVDRVFDTEEIVVKPVATVLRHLKLYSGATIMGDGSVILILDLKGVSAEAGAGQNSTGIQDDDADTTSADQDLSAILVFRADDNTLKAAPLAEVSRIEEVAAGQIERVDGRTVVQYRGKLMPIVSADAEPAADWQGGERRPLLVFARDDRAVGLLAGEIVDIVESSTRTHLPSSQLGSQGSLIIGGNAMELIDVGYYWRKALDEPEQAPVAASSSAAALGQALFSAASAPTASVAARRLLLIDQSPFAQLLLRPLLSQAGYDVTVATDPEAALALYDAGEVFSLIMADTSDSQQARDFARAFARATHWHKTPLLSLALQPGGAAAPSVLDAVSEALEDVRMSA